MKNFFRIVKYFAKDKLRIMVVLIAICVVAFIDVAIVYQFNSLDTIISDSQAAITLFVVIVAMSVLVSFLNYWIGITLKKVSNEITQKIQRETIVDICKSKVSYLEKFRKGELINRLTDDLEAIDQIVSQIIPSVVSSILYITMASIAIYLIHPLLLIVSASMILLYVVAFAQLNKRIIKRFRQTRCATDEQMNMVEDIVSGITDIRIWRIKESILNIFAKTQEIFYHSTYRLTSISKATSSIYTLIKSIANALALFVGFWLIFNGSIGIGGLLSIFVLLNNLYAPVVDLFDAVNDINKCGTNLDRVYQFAKDNKIQADSEIKKCSDNIESIEFRNVSFSYEENSVLDKVSVEFNRGNVYGIMGPTGSGKSTLLKILCGYYSPTDGDIYINDQKVSYEQYMGIIANTYPMLQDSYLFNLTISEIEYLYNDPSCENQMSLEDKLQFVELSDLISRVEDKVGSNGSNLSGGQKQRLNLIRLLNDRRDLVILDESTSALDKNTQALVLEKIYKHFDNSIIIVCSHDQELIDSADVKYVVEGGKVSRKL